MRRLLLVMVLALGANAARADDGFFYAGGGISKDKLSGITNQGTNFADIDSTSWKVFAGFRPLSVFAIEADYLDLGSADSSTHTDAKAFAGYAVGFLPIPVPYLDVFGKAGLSRVKLNGSAASPLPAASFSPAPGYTSATSVPGSSTKDSSSRALAARASPRSTCTSTFSNGAAVRACEAGDTLRRRSSLSSH
jgi:hypothetical protein